MNDPLHHLALVPMHAHDSASVWIESETGVDKRMYDDEEFSGTWHEFPRVFSFMAESAHIVYATAPCQKITMYRTSRMPSAKDVVFLANLGIFLSAAELALCDRLLAEDHADDSPSSDEALPGNFVPAPISAAEEPDEPIYDDADEVCLTQPELQDNDQLMNIQCVKLTPQGALWKFHLQLGLGSDVLQARRVRGLRFASHFRSSMATSEQLLTHLLRSDPKLTSSASRCANAKQVFESIAAGCKRAGLTEHATALTLHTVQLVRQLKLDLANPSVEVRSVVGLAEQCEQSADPPPGTAVRDSEHFRLAFQFAQARTDISSAKDELTSVADDLNARLQRLQSNQSRLEGLLLVHQQQAQNILDKLWERETSEAAAQQCRDALQQILAAGKTWRFEISRMSLQSSQVPSPSCPTVYSGTSLRQDPVKLNSQTFRL
eukprot:643684-Amphidinium_carterae.1